MYGYYTTAFNSRNKETNRNGYYTSSYKETNHNGGRKEFSVCSDKNNWTKASSSFTFPSPHNQIISQFSETASRLPEPEAVDTDIHLSQLQKSGRIGLPQKITKKAQLTKEPSPKTKCLKNDLLGSIINGMKIPPSETSEWEGQPRMTDDMKVVAMVVGENIVRSEDRTDNSRSGADKKKTISRKRRLEELFGDDDKEVCKKAFGGRGRIENLKKKAADGSSNSRNSVNKKVVMKDIKKKLKLKRRIKELFGDEE